MPNAERVSRYVGLVQQQKEVSSRLVERAREVVAAWRDGQFDYDDMYGYTVRGASDEIGRLEEVIRELDRIALDLVREGPAV